ncbi:MAG: RNA polymerase factor sigma-54 [Bacteroidetes bacterium]|nr:RNA polymerase factor sigma-54 [Bacteroidota bacterium]
MALGQRLQQKLQQKLSPQQIQLMKLLQIPTANLETRIKEELEENPALEWEVASPAESVTGTDEYADTTEEPASDSVSDIYNDIDVSPYLQDGEDEIPEYRLQTNNGIPEMEDRPFRDVSSVSFYEALLDQVHWLELNEIEQQVAEQLIGSLEEDGYLRRDVQAIVDDLAFRQNVYVDAALVEDVLKRIQALDPPGIAARNLRECLLLQVERLSAEGRDVALARKILSDYFEEFTRKNYDKLQRDLELTESALRDGLQQITQLNPKPGGITEGTAQQQYVIPDFFVINNQGRLELTLNSRNAPELRVSQEYREMLKQYDAGIKKNQSEKEAVLFIKQKIDSAKWFIDAIHQRQQTLTKVMTCLLEYQQPFFLTGDETELRPMILKDIAGKTGLDISTISRVANSKFVQTEFGTYRLKFFFSEAVKTQSGEEASTREVKKILSELIEGEDKKNPLSDDQLAELLTGRGYNVARRTVAKYREQMNISVARLRKEW